MTKHTLAPVLLLALSACPPAASPNPDGDQDPNTSDGRGFRALLSEDGGEFTCEWEEDACLDACSESGGAPELGAPELVVAGVVGGAPVEGSRLHVRVPFSDVDCDLGCGSAAFAWTAGAEGEESAGSLCSNMPCDSLSSNVYTGFDLGVAEAGAYSVRVVLSDRCGRASQPATLDFTVE